MKFICLLILFITSFASQPSYSHVKITFAYQDADNFPYQIGDGIEIKEVSPGVAVEMIQAVSNNLDMNLHLVRLPWKRGLLALEAGQIDGLFNASYKEARLKHGAYPTTTSGIDRSKRSYTNSYSLFRAKDSKLLWDGEQFNHVNKPIYAPRGFSIVDDLKKKGLTVVETSDVPKVLEQINSGFSQGIALLTPSGEGYLRNYPIKYKNIEKSTPTLTSKDYYLMLSHQFVASHPQLAKNIWQEIENFRSSDAYKLLIEKYYNLRH